MATEPTVVRPSVPPAPVPGSTRSKARRAVRLRLRTELLLVVVGAVALSVVVTWPALRDPSRTVPWNPQDPLILVWAMAWAGHALLSQPRNLFDGNTFYPLPDSLAFTENMLGYAPATWFGSTPEDALVAYNVVYALVPALAFVGAYALARQLGSGVGGALVAGAAFGFAPWRAMQAGHLHVISTGAVPLALAMLARGHGFAFRPRHPRRVRPGWALAGWATAAWQLLTSLSVGLPLAYLLVLLGVVVGCGWLIRRPRPPRALVVANLCGGALFALVGAFLAVPYYRVAERYPAAVEAARGREQVVIASLPPEVFAVPARDSILWGWATDWFVDRLGVPPWQSSSPGLLVVALALVGIVVSVWPPRWRFVLALSAAIAFMLALGANAPFGGRYGYLLLWDHLPGWSALRGSGRLVVLVSLALGLLAAGCVSALLVRVRPAAARLTIAALLPALLVMEGVARIPHPPVRMPPRSFVEAPGPVLVVPGGYQFESTVMFWSIDGFKPVANGFSGTNPQPVTDLRRAALSFPERESVDHLRSRGVRSLLVLGDRAVGTAWDGLLDAELASDLPVTRVAIGEDVLYMLEP